MRIKAPPILFILLFASGLLPGQNAFSAIFRFQNEAQESLFGASWDEFQEKHRMLSNEGFQLQDLEPAAVDDQTRFWASWSQTGIRSVVEQAEGWSSFIEMKKQKASEGWVLEDIESYTDGNGSIWYAGTWIPGSLDHKTIRLSTWQALEQSAAVLAEEYFYLVDIEISETGPQEWQYLGVYQRRAPEWRSHLVITTNEEAFYQEKVHRNKSGYPLIDLETFQQKGKSYLVGLFRKGDTEENCRIQLDWNSLQSYQKFLGEGFCLADLEVSTGEGRLLPPPAEQTRMATTPNISHQVISAIIRGNSADQSAACAAANGLLWLAQNGFPRLAPSGGGSPARTVTTLARRLADDDHMKSLQPDSFSVYTVVDGLARYSAEQNYRIKTVRVQNLRYFDERQLTSEAARAQIEIEDERPHPTLEFAREGLVGNSIVLIQWGCYRASGDGHFERQSTGWGTLVGYGVNEYGHSNSKILIIHSPAHDREGPIYAGIDDLGAAVPLSSGSSLKVPEGNTLDPYEAVPAEKAWILKGIAGDEENEYAVWEGTLVFKFEDPRIAQILQQISQEE